ncbi:glycerophosphodiester phosphodiesterase family protein [Anaeromyxobacter sp. PSR-1]|uniref:glycerophosphodiester phosphodiesterase n=1 Tax=unclassified Anaeromyxobacter TaxID=2620896 RepID=UPI0005DB269A|nr:glycerophosphodiester phosphodiesterase family protein [Anaeromyxobacter sp. PSR-1]GAO03369.1 putative glycerophosphoryl diester phosphodiesterase YhdW [Anaeromyxobacter sp. PSR-1]
MPTPNRRAPRAAGRPLVLGHRGASADAPENTLAAFRLALAQGADGVELDVWRCRTGEVVVVHDEDTGRVAGPRFRVDATPLAELRALDVGAWKGERFRGERIATLPEVLEALPGAVVNVELKSRGRDLRLAEAVARDVRRAGAEGRVIASSFDYRLVAAFRLAAPEVPVGLLFEPGHRWRLRTALAARLLGAAAVHPDAALVTPARAEAWRARGLAVNAWTVDAPDEVARLTALGAAALITNVPGRTRAQVRALTGR